jgi:hypothetical protein
MTVLDGDRDLSDAIDEPPREPWYSTATAAIVLSVMALVAVAIAVSAVLVVSREPVDPTGAVVPTIPVTTTPAPPAPTMAPTATEAPSQAPAYTPSARPAGTGRAQHDATPAHATANHRRAGAERVRAAEIGQPNDASAVPPGNHRLRGAAGNEPLVVLSNVPARLL